MGQIHSAVAARSAVMRSVGVLACLVSLACSEGTAGKGWGHTVEYADAETFAIGLERLDSLRADFVRRGYRVLPSSQVHSNSAQRVDERLIGDEPGIGEVEFEISRWDRLQEDRPEIRVHLSAELPARDGGAVVPPEWDALVERVRRAVVPTYF